MLIERFRIKYFRSILDTQWCLLSPDGVTVLVGQNESGKSSILEALAKTLSADLITAEDTRFDCPLPEMSLQLKLTSDEFKNVCSKLPQELIVIITDLFKRKDYRIILKFIWKKSADLEKPYDCDIVLEDNELFSEIFLIFKNKQRQESP